MTYRIRKAFTFDAAHQLGGLATGHKCARMHGHTYRVEIFVVSETLDGHGFVVDFAELAPLGRYIADTFDHRRLNDVISQPTSEHLAVHLADWCTANLDLRTGATVEAVRVSETPGTWAEYVVVPWPTGPSPVTVRHATGETTVIPIR